MLLRSVLRLTDIDFRLANSSVPSFCDCEIQRYKSVFVKNSFISGFFLSLTYYMPTRLDYFCNTVSIRLHALAILTQLSNISDIFIEIRNNFEKNFKNDFVPFPAFLIQFIKTVFHPVSILFLCYFSCLVGDFIDYI